MTTTEIDYMRHVDQHAGVHQPTDPAEEDVLRELYGAPDQYGVYRGEGV